MDPYFNRKLIEEVQKYDCLYNMESPEFRKVNLKNRIWEEIAEKLETQVMVCKKRWTTLRDSYTRMKRLEEKAMRESNPTPVKTFKYATFLAFLDGHKRPPSANSVNDHDDDDYKNRFEAPKYDQTDDLHSTHSTQFLYDQDDVDVGDNNFGPDCSSNHSASALKMIETEMLESSNDNNDEMPVGDPLVNRNPTSMFFECLANKVVSAGLSQEEVDSIEFKVASVVYKEISDYRKKRSAQRKSK